MPARGEQHAASGSLLDLSPSEAQSIIEDLASAFLNSHDSHHVVRISNAPSPMLANLETRYRTLVEQIPAVLFMVNLDGGIGEAYVSPYIEATLGYSQAEWLEDPVRWYERLHPDDKIRWSIEAAQMFLTGNPLRSVYRVIARDENVIWFHCEAKVVRGDDGQPGFIHGVAFDISELKKAEEELERERNFVATILDSVSTLILVLDRYGRVVHSNRAFEQATGKTFDMVQGMFACRLFETPEQRERFRASFTHLLNGLPFSDQGSSWEFGGSTRLFLWSGKPIPDAAGQFRHVIVTGIDVTESKRLERAILDAAAREQRRIAQDLHDGLGQHLTGIAFMSKTLQQSLAEKGLNESAEAGKILQLVNEAIHKTRELSRGLLPVVSDEEGLMLALERWSTEVEDLFRISCKFHCEEPVLIYDDNVATQLYLIAQEAVRNAIRHGQAKEIEITLAPVEQGLELKIRDNGVGITDESGKNQGMGMRIMNYRARIVEGKLTIGRALEGGTVVSCRFPFPAHSAAKEDPQ